jgi:hypothetical protein
MMTAMGNVEPPEIWIFRTARVVNPATANAFALKKCS